MAKQRMINTDLWTDRWVRSINPLDRLLFVYLLSNGHTNICGVYELSDDVMAFEVGLNIKDIHDAFLPRLAPKVYYKDGWIILPKFPKHQNIQSADVLKGVVREFLNAPKHIQEFAEEVGWGDGLGIVPPSSPTKLNLTKLSCGETPRVVNDSLEEESVLKPERRTKDKEAVYKLFSQKKEPWMMHAQQKIAALRLFDRGIDKLAKGLSIMSEHSSDKWCPQALTPYEYEEKLPKLNAYIKKNGI